MILFVLLDGVVRPTKSQNVSDSKVKTRRVWPYENENADRVEEQLMFVPLNYQYENAPLKSILIYTGLYSWDVREGQHEFLRKECPVNRCSITSEIKKSKDVDAILFRHQFSIPNHTKKKSQVKSKGIITSQCLISAKTTDYETERLICVNLYCTILFHTFFNPCHTKTEN